jgi:hypothetical protein
VVFLNGSKILRGRVGILLTGLILLYCCACPMPGLGILSGICYYLIVFSLIWEVVVCFVDIGCWPSLFNLYFQYILYFALKFVIMLNFCKGWSNEHPCQICFQLSQSLRRRILKCLYDQVSWNIKSMYTFLVYHVHLNNTDKENFYLFFSSIFICVTITKCPAADLIKMAFHLTYSPYDFSFTSFYNLFQLRASPSNLFLRNEFNLSIHFSIFTAGSTNNWK